MRAFKMQIYLAEREREVTEDGVIIKTIGGQADTWTYRRYQPEDVWAFRPVGKNIAPSPKARHPIDSFIDQKLEQSGAEKAPTADLRTLLRRATFDLTGLPPTPEKTEQFLTAAAKDPQAAWSDLIDRLLDSPRYGERWAQHWLDVARYSDTGGMSNDYERSNAWRYRDYVIRALNEDKPYNQFIIEQIAGDELADESLRSRIGDWEAYQTAREEGYKFFVGSPFGFSKVGQSGIEMCDQWHYLRDPDVADELCNYRGCQAESLNHPEALFHMNTGSRLGADPALGAWATYGLGSSNQNLPGYVVMTESALPQGGSRNWSNGFLPAYARRAPRFSTSSPRTTRRVLTSGKLSTPSATSTRSTPCATPSMPTSLPASSPTSSPTACRWRCPSSSISTKSRRPLARCMA